MYIKNKNIDDFCTMITTCLWNGVPDVKVFHSYQEQYNDEDDIDNPEDKYVEFIYVLFTPLYTAIYNDTVKEEEFDKIDKKFNEFQDYNCEHKFQKYVFDELKLTDNVLYVGKEETNS